MLTVLLLVAFACLYRYHCPAHWVEHPLWIAVVVLAICELLRALPLGR